MSVTKIVLTPSICLQTLVEIDKRTATGERKTRVFLYFLCHAPAVDDARWPSAFAHVGVFVDVLTSDVDYINTMCYAAVITIADFNQLNTSFLEHHHGLVQVVNSATHVQNKLTQYSQRMYLTKLLKHQGMPQQQLPVITHPVIVSRILYALPAWGGFLTVELKQNQCLFQAL